MKHLLAIALIAGIVSTACAAPILDLPVLDPNIVARVNSDPHSTWTAEMSARFDGVSRKQAVRLLGVPAPSSNKNVSCPVNSSASVNDLPASFDARTQWPQFIHPVRDQGGCGSCWAFAASEVLSDRFAIASNGSTNVVLSPMALVSCDTEHDMGCNGGWPEYAANYLVYTGIPTDVCEPYDLTQQSCPATCVDGSAKKLFKYSSWSYSTGEAAMMAALVNDGPLAVTIAVYSDFFHYKEGVYQRHWYSGSLEGYHAIKLLGYGTTDKGENYWIVQNSWGPSWGMNATFMIRRGANECGIELGALDRGCPIGGVPDLSL